MEEAVSELESTRRLNSEVYAHSEMLTQQVERLQASLGADTSRAETAEAVRCIQGLGLRV